MTDLPGPNSPPLRLERVFDCTPQEMWDAWTRPELYAKWLNPSPGLDLVIHEWDLREGGRMRFDMPLPDGKVNHEEGVFHVLKPHSRLVSGSADKSFLLEASFAPAGEGRTRVVVDITGVPSEWHAAATLGWGACFDKLAGVLKGGA
ncbi:MAG TPA: SRPBCC family protein [Candidatus Thermoplasmatota archaeon]|nr:SRPBCC family protein [Candidatus Thermoplasmatota archaeon]